MQISRVPLLGAIGYAKEVIHVNDLSFHAVVKGTNDVNEFVWSANLVKYQPVNGIEGLD